MSRARRGGARQRRLRQAILASVAGTGALLGLALWLRAARETDTKDAHAGVTATAREADLTDAPTFLFEDVAAGRGIVTVPRGGPRSRTLAEDTGCGVAWGDIDGDGDVDLYVVGPGGPEADGPGRPGASSLWRNDGGLFVDITAEAGVANEGREGMGAAFADLDGDGVLDLYVTNRGPNRLYRGDGQGHFVDVAEAAGVACPRWSTGVAFGDVDGDGDLDLYVCNYLRYDAEAPGPPLAIDRGARTYQVPFTLNPNAFDPEPNRLYLNRGDGTFEDAAEALGVDDTQGRSLAATFCDLDGDGHLDLYVNNDVSANRLYRNLGPRDGRPRFVDLSTVSGTADPRGSMGLSVGEIGDMGGTADGLPDLFLTHWVAQENAFYVSVRTPGGVEYRDRTRVLRLGEVSLDTVGWGSALVDLDLDGWVDLVVANGSTLEDRADPGSLVPEPPFLFWNTGTRFVDLAPRAGTATAQRHHARGLAAADFDGDGDVDLAVGVNRGPPLLLENRSVRRGGSLTVRLRGAAARCFGARLDVVLGARTQTRWIGADVGFLGNHAPDQVVGLGAAARADLVRVTCVDGTVVEQQDVEPGLLVLDVGTRSAGAPR